MHTFSSYKGNPIITLLRAADDKYPFSFGLTKAQLILDNIEAIRSFVAAAAKPDAEALLAELEGKLQ